MTELIMFKIFFLQLTDALNFKLRHNVVYVDKFCNLGEKEGLGGWAAASGVGGALEDNV